MNTRTFLKYSLLIGILLLFTNCVKNDDYKIPETESDMDSVGTKFAVFYTVWSYSAGAGREIVNAVALTLKDTEKANKFVTLSPLTKMAHRFHISNGAELLAKHDTCQNFEYVAK